MCQKKALAWVQNLPFRVQARLEKELVSFENLEGVKKTALMYALIYTDVDIIIYDAKENNAMFEIETL